MRGLLPIFSPKHYTVVPIIWIARVCWNICPAAKPAQTLSRPFKVICIFPEVAAAIGSMKRRCLYSVDASSLETYACKLILKISCCFSWDTSYFPCGSLIIRRSLSCTFQCNIFASLFVQQCFYLNVFIIILLLHLRKYPIKSLLYALE